MQNTHGFSNVKTVELGAHITMGPEQSQQVQQQLIADGVTLSGKSSHKKGPVQSLLNQTVETGH